MEVNSIIRLTCGPAGTGKSLRRCAMFLVDEFLPNRESHLWTNYPIGEVPENHTYPPKYDGETFVDRIAAAVSRVSGKSEESTRERIHIIPDDEIAKWKTGASGPWEFFADKDISNSYLAIDEIHNFCGRRTRSNIVHKWGQFLGEIRHRGARAEFLSQNPQKVSKDLMYELEVRVRMVAADERRVPLLRIRMGDLYELWAGFVSGKYESIIWEILERDTGGRFRRETAESFRKDPYYYQFYDSFCAPVQGGVAGQLDKHEFEKRSKWGLIKWFAWRNGFRLSLAGVAASVLIWLACGGAGTAMGWYLDYFMFMVTPPAAEASDVESDDATPAKAAAGGDKRQLPADPSQSPPEPVCTEFENRAEAAELEIERLRGEVARLGDERRRMFAVAMVTPGSVLLRNGYSYAVGETIDYGPFAGRRVQAIDFGRKTVRLDNGEILRMGWVLDKPGGGGVLDEAADLGADTARYGRGVSKGQAPQTLRD